MTALSCFTFELVIRSDILQGCRSLSWPDLFLLILEKDSVFIWKLLPHEMDDDTCFHREYFEEIKFILLLGNVGVG